MFTVELYAGPEDGRVFTVPGPARQEIRVPDSHAVRHVLGGDPWPAATIPAHIYRWSGSRRNRAVYRYVRTDR